MQQENKHFTREGDFNANKHPYCQSESKYFTCAYSSSVKWVTAHFQAVSNLLSLRDFFPSLLSVSLCSLLGLIHFLIGSYQASTWFAKQSY